MVKRSLYILALLCFLPAYAAAQQLYLPLEVRRPPVLRIASDVKSVLVVDGAKQKDPSRMCVFTAARALEELERFEEVGVMEASADSLCARYGVDALLVLGGLQITEAKGADLLDDGSWDAWLELQCMARWTIAYCQGASRTFVTADTLVWENRDISQTAAFAALPSSDDAAMEMAAYEGEQMARRLTPDWETMERYLYRNDDAAIAAGIEAFRRKNWNEAISCWNEAYTKGKETTAYAAANIALAYEMQDRYDDAIAWTQKAINAFKRLRTADAAQQVVNLTYYKTQVQTRKNYVF